jgi:hypothetical protein
MATPGRLVDAELGTIGGPARASLPPTVPPAAVKASMNFSLCTDAAKSLT